VVKLQELREKKQITFIVPKDVQVFNPRFLSISFDVSVKRPGSAKAKPYPAVYALLFEKDKDELSFYKSIFIAWIGEKDIEEYKATNLDNLAKIFRDKGGEYVYLDKKAEPVKPEEVNINGSDIKSGMISEKFIDPAVARDAEVKAMLENYVQKTSDKPAPVEDMGKIQQLEARIKKLETILANVTRSGNEIIFNNVNVVIQNGTGSTGKVNGTGNLIVGYDNPTSGSHNVIVGSKNRCSTYGSIVTGAGNAASGKFSAVTGGNNNVASGDYAVVLGGADNKSSGTFSSILGGRENNAKGEYSSINGQRKRTKVDEGDNPHFTH
jgi:hypothetical protein